MTLDARLADAWSRLPDYLGSHVLVSLTALAIGLGISLPIAIASRHRPILRAVLLGAASVVQTIPGLALLALFYPLLLAIAALSERAFGKGFSALGFLPAVLALALYSMLPVLRNTVTGLNGVDARLSEAARVVGMRPWQLLRDIELPLALPVIMAGIRTAAVWVIGTATLATPIGQTSLGNYIFTGLQTQKWVFCHFRVHRCGSAGTRGRSAARAGAKRRNTPEQSALAAGRTWSRRPYAGRVDPWFGSVEGRICHRRKDFHRTICPCSFDQAAPRGRRTLG
jgi:ABC-type proline/glycine betaine transport system permease subunit